jgi:peptidoglycan hydrolase-like protein with peptidoglycan-binding domain
VKAAQCLLKQRGLYQSTLTGRFGATTAHAVRQFQDRRSLRPTGRVDARTWTALLSAGSTPLLKRGSASDRVRAVQRALTAALARRVEVSGVFTASTTVAVRAYQKTVGLDVNGVAGPAVWQALQSGSR